MLFWKGPIMKSFSRRRHSQPYVQAEALVDARNKVFNVIMAVLLVFTMYLLLRLRMKARLQQSLWIQMELLR